MWIILASSSFSSTNSHPNSEVQLYQLECSAYVQFIFSFKDDAYF